MPISGSAGSGKQAKATRPIACQPRVATFSPHAGLLGLGIEAWATHAGAAVLRVRLLKKLINLASFCQNQISITGN
jgi:hypothetical protein